MEHLADILPTATTIFASTSAYSSPTFTEFIPFAYLAIGFTVGSMIVVAIAYWIINAVSALFGRKDRFDH